MAALDDICGALDRYEDGMVGTLSDMIAVRSISPQSGGDGESRRADFLKRVLEGWGFDVERHDYKDDAGATRSNLLVRYGDASKAIWIVAHIDTVSEGDRSLWTTNPFKAVVKDGVVYGRGACDNGQGCVSAMYALRALKDSGAKLSRSFGLALVADEELGSRYGIQQLLKDGAFGKDDLYVVPDWGTPDGGKIEIAEKGMLWMKVTVTGKQVHASTPEQGKNAHRYMARFLTRLDDALHAKYVERDSLFEPGVSTFEMTKHEKNVDSVNIIPGREVAYVDCRILPKYGIDDVMADARRLANEVAEEGVTIAVEEFNREDAAPPTGKDAEIVGLLLSSLSRLGKEAPGVVGIGGGTCAAFFRHAGIPAAVWGTLNDVAHQPNEYAVIKDIVGDAKVFASLFV